MADFADVSAFFNSLLAQVESIATHCQLTISKHALTLRHTDTHTDTLHVPPPCHTHNQLQAAERLLHVFEDGAQHYDPFAGLASQFFARIRQKPQSTFEALMHWMFWAIDGCRAPPITQEDWLVDRLPNEEGSIRTARTAFELALLDLWARHLNKPVCHCQA
jgi:hypothetical protein